MKLTGETLRTGNTKRGRREGEKEVKGVKEFINNLFYKVHVLYVVIYSKLWLTVFSEHFLSDGSYSGINLLKKERKVVEGM